MIEPTTPLVLLHAYPLSAKQWDEFPELDGRRIFAPNLPGFGGEPADAATLDLFASSVVEAMDAEGIGRAVILGLSMGGYVAFRIHARWPARVAGLILSDTRAGPDSPEARMKRTTQAERVRAEGTEWLVDAFLPDALGETTHRARSPVVERVREMIRAADPEGVARALIAMRERPDSRPELNRIAVPVLAIVGDEDRLTPLEEARAIANGVQRGTLAVVSAAGHLSNLENPEEFVAHVRAFLAYKGKNSEG